MSTPSESLVIAAVSALGRSSRNFVIASAGLWRLFASSFERIFIGPFRGRPMRLQATMNQAVRGGVDSLPLVALICLLVGMILAFQSAYQLRLFGALDLIPSLVGVSITRELAPLLTAIIVAGRYGSSIAAELGTMKVSQEVDALEVMGIDPVSYLVVPRVVGLLIALPCLVVFADLVGILGGWLIAVTVLDMGPQRYLDLSIDSLVLDDIYTGLVKAVVFALLISLVGCERGLSTWGGGKEVGRSTTSSVVRSIVLVMAADLFVTVIFYLKG